MITYVDTSTLLKRLLAEDGSDEADEIWVGADDLVSAATIVVEARAALAAARRGRRLTAPELELAKEYLADLMLEVDLIAVSEAVLASAADLAEDEALRGYDAVHLAAALHIGSSYLTSSDADLCEAARRRGLAVLNPLAAS